MPLSDAAHRWALPSLLTALAAGLVVALSALPSPWEGMRPASCMPDHCFCEGIRDGLVRQPANTLSGLLFVCVGAWIVLVSGRSPGAHNLLAARPAYGRLMGGAAILVGVGTAFYHASLTFAGQTVDVLGMYLLVSFLLLYALARLRPLRTRTLYAGYLLLNAGLLALLVTVPELRREVFAALVLATLAAEAVLRARRRVRMRTGYLVAAVLALGLGFAAWVLDLRGTLCAPGSLLQGHALWHAAGALATVFMFLFLRSERAGPEGESTDAVRGDPPIHTGLPGE